MKQPNKILSGKELSDVLNKSKQYHLDSVKTHFAKYEPINLFNNWRELIRCIDELINIPLEIDNEKTANDFLSLSFDLMEKDNQAAIRNLLPKIENQFGKEVSQRFFQFAKMNFASNKAYEMGGLTGGNQFNFSTVKSAISYYQSMRKYYISILDLIDAWAKGSFKFDFIDTLNQFQYTVEFGLSNITSSYYGILKNETIKGFFIDFRKTPFEPSHNFKNLEDFLLEPQRLSMLDQLEFRKEKVGNPNLIEVPNDKIFSYIEIENTIKLISSTFQKYKIDESIEFIELKFLIQNLKAFCIDDFNIVIPEKEFNEYILPYIKEVKLIVHGSDYFYVSNFISAFQLIDSKYFSSVVLLNRFIVNNIYRVLSKNKSFQINSGFVFEDKVANILTKYGFKLTNITRINRKEFDIITIKNNEIYNFQCKNNFIDISRIQDDPYRMAKLNNRLIKYYEKAFDKEVKRENLIIDKLGINSITHFVVTRYPVITEIDYIINFNNLENWLSINYI